MDKDKNLKLMKFWLFGTFVIIFAAASLFTGYLTSFVIFSTPGYWIAMIAAAVLCVLAFYIYRGWLNRQ